VVDNSLVDVSGAKFVGYEALVGAAIAVALVASLTVHSALRSEFRDVQKIETMLRWHPAFDPNDARMQQDAGATAGMLVDSKLLAANFELLAMAAESAVSVADQHCSTATAFRASWFVTLADGRSSPETTAAMEHWYVAAMSIKPETPQQSFALVHYTRVFGQLVESRLGQISDSSSPFEYIV